MNCQHFYLFWAWSYLDSSLTRLLSFGYSWNIGIIVFCCWILESWLRSFDLCSLIWICVLEFTFIAFEFQGLQGYWLEDFDSQSWRQELGCELLWSCCRQPLATSVFPHEVELELWWRPRSGRQRGLGLCIIGAQSCSRWSISASVLADL